MPASVTDIDTYQLVLVRLAGDVTIEDLYEVDERLQKSEPSYDLFVLDAPDARIVASPKALRDFAGAELIFSPDSRRVIMANDEVMYGLSRMYSLSATPTEDAVKVCKTLEEAANILDIPLEEMQKLVQAA